MPNVFGSLRDFGLNVLNARRPRLVFTPSVSVAVGPTGQVLVEGGVVEPSGFDSNGAWSINLSATSTLAPDCYYRVSVELLGGQRVFEFDRPLRVPLSGGNFRTLLDVPAPKDAFVVSRSNPVGRLPQGGLWFDNSGEFIRLKEKK